MMSKVYTCEHSFVLKGEKTCKERIEELNALIDRAIAWWDNSGRVEDCMEDITEDMRKAREEK